METILLVVHLLVALALIGIVLLQRSEGGALGIGGGSAGGNLFSARGVGNALTRTTAYLALGFFATSIALTVLATHRNGGGSIFNSGATTQQPAGQAAPAAPAENTGGAALPKLPSAPAQQQ